MVRKLFEAGMNYLRRVAILFVRMHFQTMGECVLNALFSKVSCPIQKLQGCCMLVRLWQGSGQVVARM